MIEIFGNYESTTIRADFEAVRTCLKEYPSRGEKILKKAGENGYAWLMPYGPARFFWLPYH